MAERPVPEAIARIDLASIADVGARQAIRALLNLHVYFGDAALTSALTVSRLMKPAPITKQLFAPCICCSSLRVSASVQW